MKILLDAGHYGYQNRSPVVPDYYESVRMFKLCDLLASELKTYGFTVEKTRDELKKDIAVNERGRMAKGFDLFISLHSNAVSGNRTVNRTDVYAAYDKRNNSHVLAALISKTVAECMGVEDGGVKTRKSTKGDFEYYGVLRGASSVGCPLYFIVEHSFHTNEKSARWLMNDENLKKLARIEAEAIASYFGIKNEGTKSEVSTAEKIELPILKNGSRSSEVKTIQILLKSYGFKGKNKKVLSLDGSFGNNTDYAVREFQKSKNISIDGIVGKQTWEKLLRG